MGAFSPLLPPPNRKKGCGFLSSRAKRLTHLASLASMSRALLKKILHFDETLTVIFKQSHVQLSETYGLSTKKARHLYEHLRRVSTDFWSEYYKKKQIVPVTIFDKGYPNLLKEIYDPPFVLFCRGRMNTLYSEKRLAIVGTRKPSTTGLKSLELLIPPLLQDGWVIVSGFAAGVDIHAHQLTVKNGGQTIAVLAHGHDNLYPAAHRPFAEHEMVSQLMISEYPPYVKPRPWQFPERNRIISGLCAGTVVIEAKEKSGSLITADQALEQGRDVFAVPGAITNQKAAGTNQLIQQGAKLIQRADDIIEELCGFQQSCDSDKFF